MPSPEDDDTINSEGHDIVALAAMRALFDKARISAPRQKEVRTRPSDTLLLHLIESRGIRAEWGRLVFPADASAQGWYESKQQDGRYEGFTTFYNCDWIPHLSQGTSFVPQLELTPYSGQ